MNNQLSPSTGIPSPVITHNGTTQVEHWLDGFFTPKPEITLKSDITLVSTYISKEPLNPFTLNCDQILKECFETYFQVLHDHYDKNGIGGSITFLQGENLTKAIQQAFIKTTEECDMLLGKTKCLGQKDQQKCRDRIHSKIEAISGSFEERNENRRLQYVTRNVKNILTGVIKGFERRYHFLYQSSNEVSVNSNGKRVPKNKFYEHQEITKYVGESVKAAVERCEAFKTKIGGPGPQNGKEVVPVDNGIKLLEDAKKSILKHGDELLAKNQKNLKETQDYIEILLSTGIEPICRKEMRKLSFPAQDEIKSVVLKIKEDIRTEIKGLLGDNSYETENCSKLEQEYQKKLDDREISMVKTCTKFAVTEAENNIINFLSSVEEKLEEKNAGVWISKFAQRNKVTEKHVNIVKNCLQGALHKAREECLGTLVACDENYVQSKEARNGNLIGYKTNEAKGNDSGGNECQIVAEQSSQQDNGSWSRKHKHSTSSGNQHEYLNGTDSQGKRGRKS